MHRSTVLIEYLEKDRQTLLRAIQEAKQARDNAPSAMESGSDTTRSEREKLMFALQSELADIDINMKKIKEAQRPISSEKIGVWNYVEICDDKTTLSLFMVPEGMGGKKINNVQLLSISSPLGQSLLNYTHNDVINFNGKNWKIIVLE